jgi:hypothetical protein
MYLKDFTPEKDANQDGVIVELPSLQDRNVIDKISKLVSKFGHPFET